MPTLTYLGPEGTFSHQAARDLARAGDDLVPLTSAPEVVQSIETGESESGVVAFENSLEGPVTGNLDELLLQTESCMIAGELLMAVSFSLFRTPGDESPLRGVASHPFGIAQCSRFIAEAGVETRETLSTAGACRELAASPQEGWGAIGPPIAGEMYGLRAELAGIEDDERATTRFLLLRRSSPEPTGRDLSAFSFRPSQDEPGSLVRILQEFSLRGINLTAIKSRPTKATLGEYIFYIECEGHIAEDRIRDAVKGVLRVQRATRFLGSFPQDPKRVSDTHPAEVDLGDAYEDMLRRVGS